MGSNTRMTFTVASANVTTPKSDYYLYMPPLLYQVIESIYLVFAVYAFISILFCLLKPYAESMSCGRNRQHTSKFLKTVDDSNSASYDDNPLSSNAAGRVRMEHKRIRQRANLTMITLTQIMSSLLLIRVTIDLWAYIEKNNFSIRAQCVRHIASGLLYLVSALCLYVFLWIRQRAFYAHPVLKHLARPGIVRFSWSVLVTIITVILSASVFFFLPQFAPVIEKGSMHQNYTKHQNFTTAAINYGAYGAVPIECGFQRKPVFLGAHFVITVAFLYFQISLQFLFGYPIFKQRRRKQTPPHKHNLGKSSRLISSTHSTPAKKISTNPTFCRLSSVPGNGKNNNHEAAINTSSRESHLLLRDIAGKNASMFSSAPNLTQSFSDEALENRASPPTTASENFVRKAEVSDTKAAFHKISSAIAGISFKDIKLLPKSNSTVTERSRKSLRRRMQLRKYVMRCLCVSIVCSISDIIVFLFVYFTQFYVEISSSSTGLSAVSESMTTSLAYNANIILNLLCMIACYKDWRQKLCPWYYVFKNSCHY